MDLIQQIFFFFDKLINLGPTFDCPTVYLPLVADDVNVAVRLRGRADALNAGLFRIPVSDEEDDNEDDDVFFRKLVDDDDDTDDDDDGDDPDGFGFCPFCCFFFGRYL